MTWFTPIVDNVSTLEFDAYDLDIKKVEDKRGRPLSFSVVNHSLYISFDRPLGQGEETTVVVTYRAAPRAGLYFVAPDHAYRSKPLQVWSQGQDEDSRHWFPCYDSPNERATSEMIVTVPDPLFALSNGKLVSITKNAKARTKTFH